MKKFLVSIVVGMMASGGAFALDIEAGLVDRVNGTYTFECQGIRTDGGPQEDWSLKKQNMDYLTYGIVSHVVVKALNEFYAGAGDKALKNSGELPGGLPVPGITE